jgi:sterol carrier protein 2
MATDSIKPVSTRSSIENAGADMTRRAASEAYRIAGITSKDVGVCELHDCFSANEVWFFLYLYVYRNHLITRPLP